MKYVIFLLFTLFLILGCSTNENHVRETILSYTNSVTEVYSQSEFNLAESVTANKQIELLGLIVNSFSQAQIRIKPTLRSIRFDQVDFVSGSMASASTSESWDFRYLRLETGKELRKELFDVTVQYALEKVKDKWLVSEVHVSVADNSKEKLSDPFVEVPEDIIGAGAGLQTDELLRNSVLAYLKLLAAGYENQNMTALFHSATKRRAMKAYYHMSSMGEGQVKMVPKLLEIDFVAVELVQNNLAKVVSNEQWIYSYFSTRNGDKVYENNASYTLTYDLIREKGNRWLVDDITIESIKEGKGKGELPFFTRQHDIPAGGDK